MKKSGSHNRKLACSAMSPRCAWVHYTAVFQSSVGYPLTMCHLSQHQLHDLQKKYIPILMNKIGIACTHAHVLVFGPRSYGGIGCNDLRLEQGLDAIQNLTRQLRTPGYRKQLATIFLRTQQNASGTSKPLLQYPQIRAPQLEGHYYAHIRRFLAKHSASLEIECVTKSMYERRGDECRMDVVCEPTSAKELDRDCLRHYTDAEIRQLYYCKCYLKVKQISDLCTADGVFILPSILKGELSIRQCASKIEDIRQERPSEMTWLIWRKFLCTLCTQDKKIDNIRHNNKNNKTTEQHSIGTEITKYWNGLPYNGKVTGNKGKYYKILYEDNDKEELNHGEVKKYRDTNRGDGRTTMEIGTRWRLKKPLGDWGILANESERLWPFYYSHNTDTLYRSYREEWHRNGNFYYDCHNMAENDTYEYIPSGNVSRLPEDASPTDVMDTEDGWRVSQHLPMITRNTHKETPATFMEYLMAQEEHIKQYYTQIEFLSVPSKIYKILQSSNKIHIATDGGAIPLKGSIGFVFADEDGTILLTCFGQPSGNYPLSFRSEICAFLAAIRLVTLITKYYGTKLHSNEITARSKIQVYTDSLSMIKKLKAYDKYPTAPLTTA
jgi:hypothetical protein